MAYDIVKLRSNVDEVNAENDLYVSDSIFGGVQTCMDIYALDERLRREYKPIEKPEDIQGKFLFCGNYVTLHCNFTKKL